MGLFAHFSGIKRSPVNFSDINYQEATSGNYVPSIRQCKRCGQETSNYVWCNACIDKRLWEIEEDTFVMTTLFRHKR